MPKTDSFKRKRPEEVTHPQIKHVHDLHLSYEQITNPDFREGKEQGAL